MLQGEAVVRGWSGGSVAGCFRKKDSSFHDRLGSGRNAYMAAVPYRILGILPRAF